MNLFKKLKTKPVKPFHYSIDKVSASDCRAVSRSVQKNDL